MKFSSAFLLAAIKTNDSHAATPRIRMPGGVMSKSMKGRGADASSDSSVDVSSDSSVDAPADASCVAAPSAEPESAVYTMTNQPNNEILVFARSVDDGSLSFQSTVSTGGSGAAANTVANEQFAFPPSTGIADPTSSQDAIVVAGKCLLAVNAGSGTVSTFNIHSASEIEFKGQFSTGGLFPNSIAERDGLVYVLNAGGDGSIQGFTLTQFNCRLTEIFDEPHGIGQSGVTPANPPFGGACPGQIGFTPSGNLLVTIKSNGGGEAFPSPASIGNILHFEVNYEDGHIFYPTVTEVTTPFARLPFGYVFDHLGRLLLTEIAGNGGAGEVLAGNPITGSTSVWEETDGIFTQVDNVIATTQGTCWIRYNPSNMCAYTTDAAGTVDSFSLAGGFPEVANAAATLNNALELRLSPDGAYLYVLSVENAGDGATGVPRIVVFETGCDCHLAYPQSISDGFVSETDRLAADGVLNGYAGLALYQG